MPVLRIAFLLCLAAGLTAPAFAQSTEETATETTAAEAATEEAPDTGLSMGEEVGAEAKLGESYVAETIDDWEMQCIRTEDGNDPCQMYQLLMDEQGTAVAEITMFRLKPGNQAVAGAMIAVPLETLLTAPLTLSVDGGKGKRYPYSFCNPVGCYARVGFTQDDINAFKRGIKATITVIPFVAPDQKVVVTMSLKGFTASFDKASIAEN